MSDHIINNKDSTTKITKDKTKLSPLGDPQDQVDVQILYHHWADQCFTLQFSHVVTPQSARKRCVQYSIYSKKSK